MAALLAASKEIGLEANGKKTKYRGAGNSLARTGTKQVTFPALYVTWRFITTSTRVHHLSLSWPNQSIPLPMTLLTGAACFLPGRAKDLSAPRYMFKTHEQNAGENNVKVGKTVTNVKCIGTTQKMKITVMIKLQS